METKKATHVPGYSMFSREPDAFGAYAVVLHALDGLEKDLLLIAKDDELGRKLQDLELSVPRRAPRRRKDIPF